MSFITTSRNIGVAGRLSNDKLMIATAVAELIKSLDAIEDIWWL